MKATMALCAACLLVLVSVAAASASQEGYVGTPGEILGDGPCGSLTVSAAEHAVTSASAVEVLSGEEGSTEDDYEFLDDGEITSWGAGGYEEANASVTLDVLENGFRTDSRVIAESPRAAVMIESEFQKGETTNPWGHVVQVGQGIGVTLRAGSAANDKEDSAAVNCDQGLLRSHGIDAFNVWEPNLILLNPNGVTPKDKDIDGAFGIFARVEYDTPVISSISSNKGPALGEQEIVVEGEHLANARRPEYGHENFATITENTNTRLKFKTPEANESEGVVEASVKPKIATFGGEATFR